MGEERDEFPVGMRVLAVDDDPTCLKVLDAMLHQCKYHGLFDFSLCFLLFVQSLVLFIQFYSMWVFGLHLISCWEIGKWFVHFDEFYLSTVGKNVFFGGINLSSPILFIAVLSLEFVIWVSVDLC